MESIEQRIERLEFYQSIILQIVDTNKWPFYNLVMENKLSEYEVNEIIRKSEELLDVYKRQKAEGLVCFSPLLSIFEQSIGPKLSLLETIDAMYRQQLFIPLMNEFKLILSNGVSRK